MDYLEELSRRSGLPIKEITNGYRCTLVSGRACYIVRHGGMIGFSAECVAFKAGKERLSVLGSGLTVRDLSREDAVVCGAITSVAVE
jgi:hypothetical protein